MAFTMKKRTNGNARLLSCFAPHPYMKTCFTASIQAHQLHHHHTPPPQGFHDWQNVPTKCTGRVIILDA